MVRWDLEEKDGVTMVRLAHSGFTNQSSRATYRGWPQAWAGCELRSNSRPKQGWLRSIFAPLLWISQKSFDISPIGYVHSTLKERSGAPRQGWEGAPNARLEIHPAFVEGLDGIQSGQDIWIFTWLHESQRSVLKVHPRGDVLNPMMGVFATRSPDRPNPIGLHRAKVLSVDVDEDSPLADCQFRSGLSWPLIGRYVLPKGGATRTQEPDRSMSARRGCLQVA